MNPLDGNDSGQADQSNDTNPLSGGSGIPAGGNQNAAGGDNQGSGDNGGGTPTNQGDGQNGDSGGKSNEIALLEDGSVDFKQYAPEGEADSYAKLNDKFKDHGDVAKGYLELQRLLSKDKMVAPTDNDGDEVWAQAYKALGHPDTPDGYKLPDGVFDEEVGSAIQQALFEAGAGQRQADKLISFLATGVEGDKTAAGDAQAEVVENAIKSLEAEAGPRNTAEYKSALDKAKIVAKHLGLDNPSFWLQEGFAAKLSKNYDNLISSGFKGQVDTQIQTGQGVEAKIDDIMQNPSNPMYTRYRDGDAAVHKHVQDLTNQLFDIQNGKADV